MTATVSKRHEPGTRCGSYEIIGLLGVGGMASLYEARHVALAKRVALKVPHEHLVANRVAAARFLREGRAAAAVRHPNVVEVFEIGVHEGAPYLVMELLEGTDLAGHLRTRGRLSSCEAVDLMLPTASAVVAAHAAGVIHRDLTPRNVFLAQRGRQGLWPKVVDFGISKVPRSEEEGGGLTETETLLGTLDYMAPEQARSAKDAGEPSDQYSLGVILYECLTGRKPFAGKSPYELLHAIVTAPFPTPRSLGIEIELGLDAVIVRAMARDPSARFPSVQALGQALLPFASETARAWWRDELEALDATSRSATPVAFQGGSAGNTESLIGTTLPESGPKTAPPGRRTIRAVTLGLGFAAFAGALASVALQSGSPIRQDMGVVRSVPSPSAIVSAEDPPAVAAGHGDPSPVPVVGGAAATTSIAQPQRPVSHGRSRAHGAASPERDTAPSGSAAASAAAPSSPSAAALTAPASAPARVERGVNGAPIVE